jgi:DNA-binding MarR family transcriptional regulator
MYRIHFTTEDLARTHIAGAPMPLMELLAAARALQTRTRPVALDDWRRSAHGLSVQARMALSLMPAVGWVPTFLSPPTAGTAEHVLDQLRATPTKQVHTELSAIAARQPIPTWARHLADDAATRSHLYDGMEHLYHRLLAPYWTRLADAFAADRAARLHQFVDGGVDLVLNHVNPQWIRWRPPVLEIRMVSGDDRDVYLAGRGVLLASSIFATRAGIALYGSETVVPALGGRAIDHDALQQTVVTYPADHQTLHRVTAPTPAGTTSASTLAAAALLGRTRAAVLTAIVEHPGCSTTELARLAKISPAGASEHATVLRQAGLVYTIRHRNTALHSATHLGTTLLNNRENAPRAS